MKSLLKNILKLLGLDPTIVYVRFLSRVIKSAINEQGLNNRCDELREVIPDLRQQYTYSDDVTDYYESYFEIKMRGLHAAQVNWTLKAVEYIYKLDEEKVSIADVGDSSGAHIKYFKTLIDNNLIGDCMSINIDPVAVEKIKNDGGYAIEMRAEELHTKDIFPDLFVSFQMVEHLTDPLRFLHNIAEKGHSEYFLISVPYRKNSRFGGTEMRTNTELTKQPMTPESVHIHEYSPNDWLLLAKFAGYVPIFTDNYWQSPRKNIFRIASPIFRHVDFEGFFVMFLKKDLTLSNRYSGW
jgi:hypothetical protein